LAWPVGTDDVVRSTIRDYNNELHGPIASLSAGVVHQLLDPGPRQHLVTGVQRGAERRQVLERRRGDGGGRPYQLGGRDLDLTRPPTGTRTGSQNGSRTRTQTRTRHRTQIRTWMLSARRPRPGGGNGQRDGWRPSTDPRRRHPRCN